MSKLLSRAKVKLENAESNYNKMQGEDAYRDDCCYNLQQSIEMSLKAIVELNGFKYAENHDLRANLNILNREGIEVPMQQEIRSMASTLYSWETETRYKDSFSSLIEDIDQAMEIARTLIKYAESLIKTDDVTAMEDIPTKKISD